MSVAPGAKLQKLAGDFKFTEGPTCDKNGNVFFVDQDNNRIMEWSADGKLSTFMQPSGYANGMILTRSGNLIACADEHNQLWSIAPDKTVTVLVTNYQGKYLNGPNDVWIAPDGAMFITDPFFRRTWWDHTTMALTNEEVYYLSPDRKTLTRRDGRFEEAQRHHRHAGREESFCRRHGRQPNLALRHPARRLADEQNPHLLARLRRHDD